MSPNGRFVLFQSLASDLVTTPKGNATACRGQPCSDAFLYDRQLGTATLVSINSRGTASGNDAVSLAVDLSANGRFVLFASRATDLVDIPKGNATACSGGPCDDLFVRDLQHGTTTLVSVNSKNTASGDNSSWGDKLTPNGRFVGFTSAASNLVANDRNGRSDVFVRDLKLGATTLVSVNRNGTGTGNGDSFAGDVSTNGRFVAFTSSASDLVLDDTNKKKDVFVRDLELNTTMLISVNGSGTASGNKDSVGGTLSPDGRFVSFISWASDLVPMPKGNVSACIRPWWLAVLQCGLALLSFDSAAACSGGPCWDVFVRDLKLGTTTLVSVNRDGTASGNNLSYGADMSSDGRFALFSSAATDLVAIPKGNRLYDVYVRDLQLGTTTLVTVNRSGTASGNANSGHDGMTPDGRFVVFHSMASDLVAVPKGNATRCGGPCPDTFVRDLRRGTTTLVSLNSAGTASGNGESLPGGSNDSSAAAMSRNGRSVVFDSFASDLVPNDTNGTRDVFVRDLR